MWTIMEKEIKYFAYLRKSTDSEDRQINSIEDQKSEIERLADQCNIKIKGFYIESKSAKKPGRPEFNKMLSEIKKGRANGILAWKLNRLSRNPVDGGEIMWLVQQGILQSIQTPGREYKTGDNVIIMSVELGLANQFILDLSKDVKRGMASKAEKGWRPGRTPLGYKNDKGGEQGCKVIYTDEDKFPIVRKMWDLMLTGNYTVPKIIEIANEEWGLRTVSKKRELKLCDRHGYKIFTNTFYYGEYEWVGQTFQGKHKPMITPEEFEYVQKILGRKGKSNTKHKDLPYRGTIRCGECGCSITTEQKIKMVKSKNVLKTYLYHHCTHKKCDTDCKQKCTTFEKINEQILNKLNKITIPQSFLDFSLEVLKRNNALEIDNRNILIKNQQNALAKCIDKLDNIMEIYISSENRTRELLSSEEFKDRKSNLTKEKAGIQRELLNLDNRINEHIELTEKTFEFATYAKSNFIKGNYQVKTDILRSLGYNFILKDGIITFEMRKQYQLIENALKSIQQENPRLELTHFALDKTKTAQYRTVFDTMSG